MTHLHHVCFKALTSQRNSKQEGHGNLNRLIKKNIILKSKGNGYLLKRKRKSLLLGLDSMNALAKARKCHESASVLNDVMFMGQVLLFPHQKANSCQLESLAFKAR